MVYAELKIRAAGRPTNRATRSSRSRCAANVPSMKRQRQVAVAVHPQVFTLTALQHIPGTSLAAGRNVAGDHAFRNLRAAFLFQRGDVIDERGIQFLK